MKNKRHTRTQALAVTVAIATLCACGLDEVELPDLAGPSEYGTAVQLTAIPDVLTADGRSFAIITAVVRDQNGAPKAGVPMFFAIADEDGNFLDLGTLSAEQVTTDGSGAASIRYTVPPRTDATADQTVQVLARPIGDNAENAVYRAVRIELRSAEPRLFPEVPNGTPTCRFIVEPAIGPEPGGAYKVNTSILFQTTSFDSDGTIVRYEWDFGDGTKSDQPDEEHHYGIAGNYTVNHVVTDDDGGQNVCTPVNVSVVN